MSLLSRTRLRFGISLLSYGLFVVFLALVSVITFALYSYTQDILENRLKDKLRAVASASALAMDGRDIEQVRGPQDVGTPPFVRQTNTLRAIRSANDSIFYAYVIRRISSRPLAFEYVVDADSMDPTAQIDINHDGVVDDEDALNTPGDEFDLSGVSIFEDSPLDSPTTDDAPVFSPPYGTFLTAYSPIRVDGRTVAVLGLDVEVTTYLALIQQLLIPFYFFLGSLVVLLTLLVMMLVNLWRRQVRFVEQLDDQKDEILRVVSHQLANPVTAAKFYTESILDGDEGEISEDLRNTLKGIYAQILSISEMSGLILDVARVELGKTRVDRVEVDLNSLLDEIVVTIQPAATERGVTLQREIPPNLPKVMLDKRLTRTTVDNLLSNAVKYTPAGGTVTLKVATTKDALSVTVSDTGFGIPADEQPRIFEKMYRASNVRGEINGNGLGLFAARGAAEAQNGSLTFQSEVNKGTTFTMALPLVPSKP